MRIGVSISVLLVIGVLSAGLGVWLMVKEKYKILREIGYNPPVPENKPRTRVVHRKFMRHKYSGSAYDRAKLRHNRFQKNYV